MMRRLNRTPHIQLRCTTQGTALAVCLLLGTMAFASAQTAPLQQGFQKPDQQQASPAEAEILPDAQNRIRQGFQDARTDVATGGITLENAYSAYQRGFTLTALTMATAVAEAGTKLDAARAMTLIGEIHAQGRGIVRDDAKAAEWYALAFDAGDMLAGFPLGLAALRAPEGEEPDHNKAAKAFRAAGEAGHVGAMYNLALLYIDGLGVERNLREAGSWMLSAAEGGNPEAMVAVAQMMREGAGLPPDDTEATRWLLEAADKGLVEAQIEAAIALFQGRGIEADEEQAAHLFRKAAELGNPVAQTRLARLYVTGRGVEASFEEAAYWRGRARNAGLDDPWLNERLAQLPDDVMARVRERLQDTNLDIAVRKIPAQPVKTTTILPETAPSPEQGAPTQASPTAAQSPVDNKAEGSDPTPE